MKKSTYLVAFALTIILSLISNTAIFGQFDRGNKESTAREPKESRERREPKDMADRSNSADRAPANERIDRTTSERERVAATATETASPSSILRQMRRESYYKEYSSTPYDARLQEYRLAMFANSLPSSDNLQRLQKEMGELNTESTRTTDPERMRQILASMATKSAQIQSDPVYVQNVKTLAGDLFPDDTPASRLYRAALLSNSSGGGESAIASNASTSTSVASSPPPLGVDYSQLRPGDIMLIRHPHLLALKIAIYALYYTHAGNYLGNQMVLESNEDGVRIKPLRDWQIRGACVALGRDNKRTSAQVSEAVEWAKNQYGMDGRTPYNYDYFNKLTDSRLYCSQLTWKIHNHLGIDLDSNDYRYLASIALKVGLAGAALAAKAAVAPDEIRYSPNVDFYAEGCN